MPAANRRRGIFSGHPKCDDRRRPRHLEVSSRVTTDAMPHRLTAKEESGSVTAPIPILLSPASVTPAWQRATHSPWRFKHAHPDALPPHRLGTNSQVAVTEALTSCSPG